MIDFKDIKFGYASAEVERSREPELLREGFLNHNNIIEEAQNKGTFLFLGRKGSGKSALAEHMTLLQEEDPLLFVTTIHLSDFPFNSFKKLIRGDEAPELKYPMSWAWLLLIKIFNSLHKDQKAEYENEVRYNHAIDALRSMGLLDDVDLHELVRRTSKRSYSIEIPSILKFGYTGRVNSEAEKIPFIVDKLRKVSANFRSESKHIIILDGLDDVLTHRKVQYQSLAALILEANRLNNLYEGRRAPIKVIVLCRTDIYEILPGPNKNKIRQDSAFVIDWYKDTSDPSRSNLVRLANKRANLYDDEIEDVIYDYMPNYIFGRNTYELMLDMTRHTPRDFLHLLDYIGKASEGGKISKAEFKEGCDNYSIEYLLPEMKDELVGQLNEEEIKHTFMLLDFLDKREFEVNEIEEKAKSYDHFKRLDLNSILKSLFNCSAIGNKNKREYVFFKHRNKNHAFDKMQRVVVHRGLWKALNLV